MLAQEEKRNTDQQAEERVSVASQWQLIRWRFVRHKVAVASLVLLAIMYFVAVFAEVMAPYDPRNYDVDYMWAPPQRIHFFRDGRIVWPFVYGLQSEIDSVTLRTTYTEDKSVVSPIRFFVKGDAYELWGFIPGDIHVIGVDEGTMFLLGTDKQGRDLLSRIIHGSRLSLSVGLVGIAVSFFIGVIIGGVSGYFGGAIDLVIQRIIEFIRGIPHIPLWMALSVALPPDWSVVKVYFGIVVILSLVGWTGLARVVRGKFMALREEDFVMAARLVGANEARVIFRHMLPSFFSYIIANLTLAIPSMILGETALSFIGLGLQAPAISWGVLLKESQHLQVLANVPWLLIPAIFVIVTILCFNFVGDGLRDAADPYSNV
jgi:peptide/nickel transport system permease protein